MKSIDSNLFAFQISSLAVELVACLFDIEWIYYADNGYKKRSKLCVTNLLELIFKLTTMEENRKSIFTLFPNHESKLNDWITEKKLQEDVLKTIDKSN